MTIAENKRDAKAARFLEVCIKQHPTDHDRRQRGLETSPDFAPRSARRLPVNPDPSGLNRAHWLL
jgi:hypothetical protein